jgi:flagellar basal body rod protein FlgB
MLSLINFLILFFILLLVYQIFLASFNNYIIEGLDNQYKPYDTNNPSNTLILTQQNAGNINFLKQQMDSLLPLTKEVKDISGNVVALQNQVNQLVAAQQQYANNLTGGQAPEISGAV